MRIDPVANGSATVVFRERSQTTPPGLEQRGLSLPPGQTHRPDGNEIPAGIAKRFPIPAPPPAPQAVEIAPSEATDTAPGNAVDLSA